MKKIYFFILLSFVSLGFSSCKKKQCIDGDQYPRGVMRTLPPFTAVNVHFSGIVELVKDTAKETPFVELIVEENLQTHLATEVINDTLDISLGFCFSNHSEIIVRVHYDTLNTLTVSGPGDIISKGKMVQDDLTLNIRSSGDIDLTTDIKNLTTNINGTGEVRINGQIEYHNIIHQNSGNINTYQAMTDSVVANITGSGNAYLRIQRHLTLDLSGKGDLYYKGFPYINSNITGSGKLINDN